MAAYWRVNCMESQLYNSNPIIVNRMSVFFSGSNVWKKKSEWKCHITKPFECYTHLYLPKFSIRRANFDSNPLRYMNKWLKTCLTVKWDRDVACCPFTISMPYFEIHRSTTQIISTKMGTGTYRTLSLVPFQPLENFDIGVQNHEFSIIEFYKNLYLRVYLSISSGMLPSEEYEWKVIVRTKYAKIFVNTYSRSVSRHQQLKQGCTANLYENSSWLSADTLKRKESRSSNCFVPVITTKEYNFPTYVYFPFIIEYI